MAYDDCLSASWLAERSGIDVALIERMRRGGELMAVRRPHSVEWLFPTWQFKDGRPRGAIQRIVAAARAAHLDDARLYDVMTMRMGLGGQARRLVDLLLAGEDERVIAAVRESRPD